MSTLGRYPNRNLADDDALVKFSVHFQAEPLTTDDKKVHVDSLITALLVELISAGKRWVLTELQCN